MDAKIATPPETDFLVPFLQALEHDRGLEGLASLGFEADHIRSAYRYASDYFYSNYADSLGSGVQVVLDKSPSYVSYIDGLQTMFPKSKLICLTRHPLGQIGSATRYGSIRPEIPDFPEGGAGVLADAIHYWNQNTTALLELSRSSSNALLVRYEDLCKSPEPVLREVFDFLELPWNSDSLRYDGSSQDRGKEGAKALGLTSFNANMAEPTRGWQEADLMEVKSIWHSVKDTASSLDYSID